jgi:phosphoribosylaminoimidazolecarboxamide formyltransferase/IMP cyclohydrolase
MLRALISVSNKTGLIPFATRLHHAGVELVSTSGTAKAIKDAGLPCTLVEEVTGFPEMLDGRVRTLHPKIFAGIIANQCDPVHMAKILEYDILPFGIVAVNLYDFAGHPSIEQIDVGGPSMIRAAAKNYNSVTVVVDPADYDEVAGQIELDGDVDERVRLMLAAKAFEASARYERIIADHFRECVHRGINVEAGVKH